MKRVTLADVAARAGVSRAAASLAVRGTGRISDDTRRRIHQAIEELGYVYHRGAATLRTRKSSVVGLIVTNSSNPFFAEMSLGIEQSLSDAGYLTVLTNTFDDPDRFEQLVLTMLEHPVDALVYVPVAQPRLPIMKWSGGVPALAVTRQPPAGMDSLTPDDFTGGRIAAEHLADRHARRRMVYLGGPATAGPRGRRVAGARAALHVREAELVAQLPGETTIESGLVLADQLLSSGIAFDSVICHSDLIAFALCHVLRTRGRAVPEDIAVVGFDGLDQGAIFAPTITSVSVGPRGLGHAAAEWVLQALDDAAPRRGQQLLEPDLVIRESCGCLRWGDAA